METTGKYCFQCANYIPESVECRKSGKYVGYLWIKECFSDSPVTHRQEVNIKDGYRVCIHCRRELPITDFQPHHKSLDGYSHTCRSCYSDHVKRIGKAHKQAWSQEEINFLREAYNTMTASQIATKLGRTYNAVVRQVVKQGISCPRERLQAQMKRMREARFGGG